MHRYSLTTGKTEVFVDKIPAMPDGIPAVLMAASGSAASCGWGRIPRLLAPYPL